MVGNKHISFMAKHQYFCCNQEKCNDACMLPPKIRFSFLMPTRFSNINLQNYLSYFNLLQKKYEKAELIYKKKKEKNVKCPDKPISDLKSWKNSFEKKYAKINK